MHKLLLIINVEKALKKLLKKKNTNHKSVNNHKINYWVLKPTKSYNLSGHKILSNYHIVNKELGEIFSSLIPIYQDLTYDYDKCDLIDLEFYERWLNE